MSSVRGILIAGAGEAGRAIAREYQKRRLARVCGFIDDDPSKKGLILEGVSVLGPTSEIVKYLQETGASELVIAMPSALSSSVEGIIKAALEGNPSLSVHVVPGIERYFDNVPLVPSLSDISYVDLFQRDEINVDVGSIMERFRDSVVLVTGAGGSIGSELCRQLLKFPVKRIIALGRGEHSIYQLSRNLSDYINSLSCGPTVRYAIMDVRNSLLLERLFEEEKPAIVFHAAAHKHVPLMEENPSEALSNNAGGTASVLEACHKSGTSSFTLVSTDKAVRPSSVMGATKRVAELVTMYYSGQYGLNASVVRFGNVAGSRGSVIPLFLDQIRSGGPVTLTHNDATRFFMTIPEAAILVVNAAAYSRGGELYVLDMGKPHRIRDLAERLIGLHGLDPCKDIEIRVTGLRQGEKIHEELFYENETLLPTQNERILRYSLGEKLQSPEQMMHFLEHDLPCLFNFSEREVKEIIKGLVSGYC